MKIIEEIASDDTYINYAKNIDPVNYLDLYHDAILKVHNKTHITKSYFYLTLKSIHYDKYRKKKPIYTNELNTSTELDNEEDDLYYQALLNFINRDVKDERIELMQVIIDALRYMSVKDLAEKTGYSKRVIYNYVKLSKKHIKDEYNNIVRH